MSNYVKLKSYNPWSDLYAYVDRDSYLADSLFVAHGVKCKFRSEMVNDKIKGYVVVFVDVPRRYKSELPYIFSELENKMLLYGYRNYMDICKLIFEPFIKQ